MLDTQLDQNDEPWYPPDDNWNPGGPGPWDQPPTFDPGQPWGDGPISDILDQFPTGTTPPPGGAIDPSPTQNPSPSPSPTGGSGGGSGGGGAFPNNLLAPFGGTFTPPTYGNAWDQAVGKLGPIPQFNAPELPKIDPFTYDAFAPTTGADVFSDPSFGFRKDIGEKALLNNRAAQGLLRTGGTLKDLLGYNQNFASQEFGNVDARRHADYDTNRGNALGNWTTNADATFRMAGMDQDRAKAMYEPQLVEWTSKANVGQHAEDNAWDQAYKSFLTDYDIWHNQQNDAFNKLKWQSEFGLDAATR